MSFSIKIVFSLLVFSSHLLYGQHKYETLLYQCIKQDLSKKGYNLEKGLNSFENQLKEIGYLSDSTTLYHLFKKQAKCETPLIIKNYVNDIDIRINNFYEVRNLCYSSENSTKRLSKFFKTVEKLKLLNDDNKPWVIWKTIHSIIDENDYSHPFYRMNALVTLHSWSIDRYDEYALDNNCF